MSSKGRPKITPTRGKSEFDVLKGTFEMFNRRRSSKTRLDKDTGEKYAYLEPMINYGDLNNCVGRMGDDGRDWRRQDDAEDFMRNALLGRRIHHTLWTLHKIFDATESPIERVLLSALYIYAKDALDLRTRIWQSESPRSRRWLRDNEDYFCVIEPQHVSPGKKYRADFAIFYRLDDERRRMIVECDGHDFHEKTKAQAARDRRRDRFFAKSGYKIARFTGSEVWKDPFKCAEEAFDVLFEGESHKMLTDDGYED